MDDPNPSVRAEIARGSDDPSVLQALAQKETALPYPDREVMRTLKEKGYRPSSTDAKTERSHDDFIK